MARKISSRTAAPASTPRHFWLAGLGFVSIAGRRTVETVGAVAGRAAQARQDAISAVRQARSQATSISVELRERIEATTDRVNGVVERTLSPLLEKLRPTRKAKRAPRRGSKPTAKNARRTATRQKVVRRTRRG